jgi:hypothetical protein
VSPVHRPTAVRAGLLSAAFTLILYAVVSLLAPTLIDLTGAGVAEGISLIGGLAARLLAGRLAARPAWSAGADLGQMLVSVLLGGLVGWLLFPGWVSLIGVATGSDAAGGLTRLLVNLGLWEICLLLGAGSARSAGVRGRRRRPDQGPGRGRSWALRPKTARATRP